MAILPVIVGIGGINAAGRSSGFHGYKRMVHEVLSADLMESTWRDLAHRMGIALDMGLTPEVIKQIKAGTLIRRIEAFDPAAVPHHFKGTLENPAVFLMKKSKLPQPVPAQWKIEEIDAHTVRVHLAAASELLLIGTSPSLVSVAGELPRGFDPKKLYNSHHHPRGLSLAIYGASDALHDLGMPWEEVLKHIHPDEVSVYAGSAMGQIDADSLAGLISEPLCGNRVNSKMMPMSLPEMPADFINSYVINSVGQTGTQVGACATFLYNVKQGIMDIQAGRAKVAIVGASEAPVVPDVIAGFAAMGALASDESLRALDKNNIVDTRRACRPFSSNTGFTMAEGSQFMILMDDALALKLGAKIYGTVADVFIHADGNKKSIAKPGVGNYLTFSKATALAQAILGQTGLQQHTYVQAHGTGTPQNRTTESHLLNLVAETFGISHWPVTAVKAYVGHTIGVAAGDQVMSALGVWQFGYVPGIKTIDHIADDVYRSHLNILTEHTPMKACQAVLINSKGFGGNNATGLLLSPQQSKTMLLKKHGKALMQAYEKKNEAVKQKAAAYDAMACEGREKVYYTFADAVMTENDVKMTQQTVQLSGFEEEVLLPTTHPYDEYL